MAAWRLAVVGAGPAGLTAALAARQAGLDAVLFERRVDFKHVGGGVLIHSNGQRALATLGLLDGLRPRLALRHRLTLETDGGRTLSRVDLRRLDIPHAAAAVIMRYDLLDYLVEAAWAADVPTHFGRDCAAVATSAGGLRLRFADGAALDGFDAVIGADGIHSRVRESAGLAARKVPVGEAYLRGIAERPPDRPEIREIWGRDGRRFGLLPLPGNRTYFYCSVPLGRWQAIRAGELDRWVAGWRPFGAEVVATLRAVRDWDTVSYDELFELHAERWTASPVFLIGDAVHAMTPNLGQGANSAMVDAVVLVRLLAQAEASPAGLAGAGATFENLRRPFVTRTQRAAHLMGKLAGITAPPLRRLRDTALRLADRIPALGDANLPLIAGWNPAENRYLVHPLPARAATRTARRARTPGSVE